MENFSTILQTVWRPAQKNSWGGGCINPPLTGRGLSEVAARQIDLFHLRYFTGCMYPDSRLVYVLPRLTAGWAVAPVVAVHLAVGRDIGGTPGPAAVSVLCAGRVLPTAVHKRKPAQLAGRRARLGILH